MASGFPAAITGEAGVHHKFAHGNPTGKYDAFLASQLAYFVGRLKDATEGANSLLDNTMVLFGSSNSKTHVNRNYPLVLAGGSNLGLKHGRYLKYPDSVPLREVRALIYPLSPGLVEEVAAAMRRSMGSSAR